MTLNYKNEETLYVIFKKIKTTLTYKNEETLYVIFFLYVRLLNSVTMHFVCFYYLFNIRV